jgi:hypothetical protein
MVTKKQERYRKRLNSLNQITDKLGMPIDPGIKKTVVLLNLLGFRTVGSCGGHVDLNGGTLTPWIDIQPRSGSFKRKVQKLLREYWDYSYKKSHSVNEFLMPYLWQFDKPKNQLRIQIGHEIFNGIKQKKKVPKPVRIWVFKEKQKALKRFTDYLWLRYTQVRF